MGRPPFGGRGATVIRLCVEVTGNSIALEDPRIPVLTGLAQRLEGLDALQAYGQGLPDQQVQIALADVPVMQRWTLRPDILGCHVLTAGRFAGPYYIDQHLCLINMSTALFSHLLAEDDGQPGQSLQDSVASWLLTLPHEVAHIAEFIRAGGGRPPQTLYAQTNQDHAAVLAAAGWEEGMAEPDDLSPHEWRIEQLAQQWYAHIRPAPAELEEIIRWFSTAG